MVEQPTDTKQFSFENFITFWLPNFFLACLHPIYQREWAITEQYIFSNANNPLYYQQTQMAEVADKVNYKNNATGICVSNCI